MASSYFQFVCSALCSRFKMLALSLPLLLAFLPLLLPCFPAMMDFYPPGIISQGKLLPPKRAFGYNVLSQQQNSDHTSSTLLSICHLYLHLSAISNPLTYISFHTCIHNSSSYLLLCTYTRTPINPSTSPSPSIHLLGEYLLTHTRAWL